MLYPTLKKARMAATKHDKIVRVKRHTDVCLFSDGTIILPYPCTCGSQTFAYALVLDRKGST